MKRQKRIEAEADFTELCASLCFESTEKVFFHDATVQYTVGCAPNQYNKQWNGNAFSDFFSGLESFQLSIEYMFGLSIIRLDSALSLKNRPQVTKPNIMGNKMNFSCEFS